MNVEKQELSLDEEGAIDIIDNLISPESSPEDQRISEEEVMCDSRFKRTWKRFIIT
jgi:hypothetical protein